MRKITIDNIPAWKGADIERAKWKRYFKVTPLMIKEAIIEWTKKDVN